MVDRISSNVACGGWCSRVARQAILSLALAVSLLVVIPGGAEAQDPDTTISVDTIDAVGKAEYSAITMPPLPFRAPQVGPELRRAFADDVNRRTTAFIPSGELPIAGDFEIPPDERWIRIDLGRQQAFAYEGETPVRGFIISSGLPRTPTVTGEFRIRMKVSSQTMSGGDPELGNDYNLPNVQWVQYFHEDYGLHGTYWHNNFGKPMSHGCVNMTNADAKWLFDWAGPAWDGEAIWQRSTEENPGTLVYVHQ